MKADIYLRNATEQCIKISRKNVLMISQLILLFALCYFHALSAGHTCDFWPINGTFQNFNPIRRLLSGQVPYRDFYDYLGMGHLYAGSIATFLFGGNYQASLMAFSFLQILSFSGLSLGICYAVTRSEKVALVFTNIFLTVLFLQPPFYADAILSGIPMRNALNSCLSVGNSARFIRGMILPLCISFFLLGKRYIPVLFAKSHFLCSHKNTSYAVFFGLLTGFSILWSNDYGISAYICLHVLFLWITFCGTRKAKKTALLFLIYTLSAILGMFAMGEILTIGHFSGWLKNTFGIGDFQRWYYSHGASSYIFEIDLSFLTITQFLICAVYFIKIFFQRAERRSVCRYGIPAFCNLTAYCAINEYKLLSGGLIYEVAYSVLFLTLASETASFLMKHVQFTKKHSELIFHVASLIVCGAWIISSALHEMYFYTTSKTNNCIAELGRGGVSLYSDLIAAKSFLCDKKIFSTYASAQEVLQNQFQPSGYDYIIHVLGDRQRKEYMESFHKGDFDYVATIREEHNDWENWIKRANWFFYRELYASYHPVFENGYERYWGKNQDGIENSISAKDVNLSLEIEYLNLDTKKIIIDADDGLNGVADLFIDYEVLKNSRAKKSKFIFNMNLLVEETALSSRNVNSLRKKSAEYIPIEIRNGHGEILLRGKPAGSTRLEIRNLRCERIFCIPEAERLKPPEASL